MRYKVVHANRHCRFQSCLWLLLLLFVVSGCTSSTSTQEEPKWQIIWTMGFGKDEVFRMGEDSCTIDEMLVYQNNLRLSYDTLYGDRIWELTEESSDALNDHAQEMILAQLMQIKAMNGMAREYGISLTGEEQQAASLAAAVYYESLSDEAKEAGQISKMTLVKMYKEYHLARKLYETLIDQINPEFSDDMARVVVVQRIYQSMYTLGEDGEYLEYSQQDKQQVILQMQEVANRALEGEDFVMLATQNSEAETVLLTVARGELSADLEDEIFRLATGEVSSVIVSSDGCYLFRCLSAFDEEKTETNREAMILREKEAAFATEYDAFTDKVSVFTNKKVLEQLLPTSQMEISEVDFFEVYKEYLE